MELCRPPRLCLPTAQPHLGCPLATYRGVYVKRLGKAMEVLWNSSDSTAGPVFPIHEHLEPEFIYRWEGETVQNGQTLTPGWAAAAEEVRWIKISTAQQAVLFYLFTP